MIGAKEALQVETLRAVADKGYHEADQLEKCEQAAVETFVPAPGSTSGRGKEGQAIFPKERFRYDAVTDAYHCPGGQILPRSGQDKKDGKDRLLYYAPSACRNCP